MYPIYECHKKIAWFFFFGGGGGVGEGGGMPPQ